MNSVGSNNLSLKYQRFKPSDSRDMGRVRRIRNKKCNIRFLEKYKPIDRSANRTGIRNIIQGF